MSLVAKKPVVFTGHNAYMMSVARVCREALKFTDVNLICSDGSVAAHRLILAAASSTLRAAFLEVPANDAEGLTEYSIIVPDVTKNVVASLVDFLYTGKLIISRSNARDLQLLVKLLGIDPDNVRVEALEESTKKRIIQSQLTTSMGLVVKQNTIKSDSTTSDAKADEVKTRIAAKRRLSNPDSSGINGNGKEPKISVSSPAAHLPLAPIGSGFDSSNKAKRPPRPTRPTKVVEEESSSGAGLLSGYHDMSNVETWVCAICHLYDPAEGDTGDTTEWIGCDCNRWYHKLCTGLAVVDESFCCDQVKLECLPMPK